jgi:hypothetical protein
MRLALTKKGLTINKVLTLKEFNDVVIKNTEDYPYTFAIYKTILRAMEKKYSWLGRQVTEELLDSLASSIIDRCYDLPFRANQHVLLIWDSGWFKSSILSDFQSMMPKEYIGGIGTISDAALRGTVETAAKPGCRFVPPSILSNDFIVVREFGKGLTDDMTLKQTLLNALEDQEVHVSLAKFAQLDSIERRKPELDFKDDNFIWDNDTSFTYKTKVTLWAANYTPIEDAALLSRFNIVYPEKLLDEDLMHYVMTHPYMDVVLEPGVAPLFMDIQTAVDGIMANHRPPIPFSVDLREELKGVKGLSPRVYSNIIKKLMASAWWGFNYDTGQVRALAMSSMMAKTDSQKSFEDDVIDMLKSGWYTLSEIAIRLGIPYSKVYSVLNKSRDTPFLVMRKRDPKDARIMYLHMVEQDKASSANLHSSGMKAPVDNTKVPIVELPKPEKKKEVEEF